jgi:demethylmenaquinone methyltransferase/2-methoxy-6-polyprenyl-1,4-benzoquinol methylase
MPTKDQDPEFVRRAFGGIAKRYVLANHVLSGGIDVLWRRRVAKIVAESEPGLVLDLATGSGDLARAVSEAAPAAEVIGADFCQPMLEEARRRAGTNLLVADGMSLPFSDGVFDAMTIGFGLRNMESWEGAAGEMARVIRPGGVLVVLDFALPRTVILRGPYRFYLHHILPVIAGALTGKGEAYRYLGDSIERFPSGDAMVALLTGAGFSGAVATPLSGGIASIYTATR